MTQTKTLTQAALRQFTGDLERFRDPFYLRVIYSPGVKYVAEAGRAYWLINAIETWFYTSEFETACKIDSRVASLHFWKLTKKPDLSAVLTARADSPDRPFITQQIEYTDFPLDEIDIWAAFDGTYWTLYLPSEH